MEQGELTRGFQYLQSYHPAGSWFTFGSKSFGKGKRDARYRLLAQEGVVEVVSEAILP